MALTQISTEGVKDDAVTAGKIPANAVGSSELADNAVDTAAIADNAVTAAKIVGSAINSARLADDAVTTDKIADNAVTADQIAGSAVTTARIADDSVTGAKIADDAVGAEHIEVLDANLQFADNAKAQFGTGNDLEIYHDGSNSYLQDVGTGALYIDGSSVRFRNYSNSETMAQFIGDGQCELYYDNSKKLETTSAGARVTGNLHVTSNLLLEDNDKAKFGDGEDLQIYHDGGNSWIKEQGSGALYIDTDSSVHITKSGASESIAKFYIDGAVELYHDGNKKLNTSSTGIQIHSVEGGDASIELKADEGDDNADYWKLVSNADGSFRIQNYADGAWENSILANGGGNTKLFYNNSEKLETNNGGITINGAISGGDTINTSNNGDASATFNRNSSTGVVVELRYNGTNRGTISTDGSVVAFNTSASDRTLKKNFEDWTDSVLPGFKALKPQIFNFTFEEDGDAKHKGYIAQDNVAAFPEAYPKDDNDKYQFNASGMVHYLMKAVQELSAEVDTLKAKVAALEAK